VVNLSCDILATAENITNNLNFTTATFCPLIILTCWMFCQATDVDTGIYGEITYSILSGSAS